MRWTEILLIKSKKCTIEVSIGQVFSIMQFGIIILCNYWNQGATLELMQHWKDLETAKRAWWILMTSEDYTCGPRFCSNSPKELVPSPISYWPSSSFNDRYQGEEIVWLHQTTYKISYRSKELSFIQAVNACYIDCCHSNYIYDHSFSFH